MILLYTVHVNQSIKLVSEVIVNLRSLVKRSLVKFPCCRNYMVKAPNIISYPYMETQ